VQKWSQRISPKNKSKEKSKFAKIKEALKERHFDDFDDIRSNMTTALKAISQNQFRNHEF